MPAEVVQSAKTVFLSHATPDKPFVVQLHEKLAAIGIGTWMDARELTGGGLLDPAIMQAIDTVNYFLVVFSPKTVNSRWVTKELRRAQERQRTADDGFKVIPLLIDGMEPSALHIWFDEEPLAIKVESGPGGLDKAMPHILAALGERLPTVIPTVTPTPPAPVAELILELTYPAIEQQDGKRRAIADATLHYRPANATAREVESEPYAFTAPLGPIETDDLTWYLESYYRLPITILRQRAQGIEAQLPVWGKLLYGQVMQAEAQEAFRAWNEAGKTATRRFTVSVASKSRPRSDANAQTEAQEAATLLLALPWELLHDERSYLFEGARGVRVRRQLPNRFQQEPYTTNPPIRVLLVSPRPDNGKVGYIDHRVSARPVVDALAPLGDLAHLTLLTPPTFPALVAELTRAKQAGTPYHVVHFDGHGVYNPQHGLGALVFEDPNDQDKPDSRSHVLVDAQEIAAAIRDCRVPLFFLEACQSAMSDKDPTASVAGKLLEGGVASVVAMSHSVLVETARRFVTAFYAFILQGERVGQAMLAGQRVLQADTRRGKTFAGDLHLQDWFVPVLYQEEHDPQLVAEVPTAEVQRQKAKASEARLGNLPPVPTQTFVGRSRELLYAERMLYTRPYVTIQGEGGEGKTTLAAELARWLVHSGRFARAAFVSFEKVNTAEATLSELGTQLVTNYQSLAGQGGNRGWQAVERVLSEQPTIIVLDNLESVLQPPANSPGASAFEPDILAKILGLCEQLHDVPGTKLVFTSREAMPPPFQANTIRLGRLSDSDAVQLVAKTLAENAQPGENVHMPGTADADASEEAIQNLVEAVGGHARALVLIARKVAEDGIRDAATKLNHILNQLQQAHPDDRERSLLASVKLSLDRLPPETRRLIRPLGVCQGGISLTAMNVMLQIKEEEQLYELERQLVGVGLAEPQEHGYLRFDPALCITLLSEMDGGEQETARASWAETMQAMAEFLYRQQFSNPHFAFSLASWELPNLLAALEHQAKVANTSDVVAFATIVENLAQSLGRGKVVAQAERIRETAADTITEWSHAVFAAARSAIDRLLNADRFEEAIAAAKNLLHRCEAAEEAAYPGAAYDIAMAYAYWGRARKMSGASGAAIAYLEAAEDRFTILAQTGDRIAAHMASFVRTELADCLTGLGRLEEAIRLYEQAIQEDQQRDAPRDVAVGKGQLGIVRMLQGRYADALLAHQEARDVFERLGEPHSVAEAWHQIGMICTRAGNYLAAEQAHQNALQIACRLGDRGRHANSLNELGTLYRQMERYEEAGRFYREAAAIHEEQKNLADEGRARSNAAITLLALQSYEEARSELERAIVCKAPFGHATEPWKTFNLLHNLERAVGNKTAALAARQQAIHAYLAYLRDGGESTGWSGQVVAGVAQALAAGQNEAVAAQLAKLLNDPEMPDERKPLLRSLQRLVSGERDPALADAPDLFYMDAVELRLLLETLSPPETTPSRPPVLPRQNRTSRRTRPARE